MRSRSVEHPAHAATLGGASRRRWAERFARVPDFRCSDPYLEHYYWYRWYGLWLNAIEHDAGAIAAPAICEGIGELHTPSVLAAPAHVRELRWLDSPELRARRDARHVRASARGRQHARANLRGSSLGGSASRRRTGATRFSRSTRCGRTMRFCARCTRRSRATPTG